jgi:hypothetical protein
VVSLLLMSAFEPLLLLRWIARLNLKTIPDYPTVALVWFCSCSCSFSPS